MKVPDPGPRMQVIQSTEDLGRGGPGRARLSTGLGINDVEVGILRERQQQLEPRHMPLTATSCDKEGSKSLETYLKIIFTVIIKALRP
jgi:hypothetical protein